ncbi:Alpha-1,3-mannosyltransferase cmt1 [Dionaea muscipula]
MQKAVKRCNQVREDPTFSSNRSKRSKSNEEAEKRIQKPESIVVDEDEECRFTGNPVPLDESRQKWPDRYLSKGKMVKKFVSTDGFKSETIETEVLQARCHYTKAIVDGVAFKLYDDAYVKAGEGQADYIAKIIEFFETSDRKLYFTAQWFYRARDTVIKDHGDLVDCRRVFFSDIKDDNPLDCIVSKVKIARIASTVDNETREKRLKSCDLYCDMRYSLPYITFTNFVQDSENLDGDKEATSTISSDSSAHSSTTEVKSGSEKISKAKELKPEVTLLDLYSGCGAMSTGLCYGAALSGANLVNRWAVDLNPHACKSLKKNHPETQVRNEAAEDFLSLLKEWEKLCTEFSLLGSEDIHGKDIEPNTMDDSEDDKETEMAEDSPDDHDEEFEVERLLAICYGDPNEVNKRGLFFKVRWKGYGPSKDTWEPIEGLSNCRDSIQDFVGRGYRSKILPLPGDVHVICGGPPCQGISGFNRFRNIQDPLKDVKNHQLVVFMDIVNYLKPNYVLMENVVDLLKFAGGFLGRYALGRLVGIGYQTRLGIMAAGSYGLPQVRMRAFIWGAHPTKILPQFPLPTHNIIGKGLVPVEFEDVYVSHGKDGSFKLEKALDLGEAISDLPEVTNYEDQDERPYGTTARTQFQKYIRLKKDDIVSFDGSSQVTSQRPTLYDHRPLQLNEDDYQRVCQIPKEKGANFRNLPGVEVGEDKKVRLNPSMERVYLPSGKPLVPDYAIKFVRGKSLKPFGRLWWDEIVSTVVTRAEPHNQAFLHPTQDRVLTIREIARLQGFPDCYRLYGPVKERYIQVGNAVAVPVAMALGYTLGKAAQNLSLDEPLTTLPLKFPKSLSKKEMVQTWE